MQPYNQWFGRQDATMHTVVRIPGRNRERSGWDGRMQNYALSSQEMQENAVRLHCLLYLLSNIQVYIFVGIFTF